MGQPRDSTYANWNTCFALQGHGYATRLWAASIFLKENATGSVLRGLIIDDWYLHKNACNVWEQKKYAIIVIELIELSLISIG